MNWKSIDFYTAQLDGRKLETAVNFMEFLNVVSSSQIYMKILLKFIVDD